MRLKPSKVIGNIGVFDYIVANKGVELLHGKKAEVHVNGHKQVVYAFALEQVLVVVVEGSFGGVEGQAEHVFFVACGAAAAVVFARVAFAAVAVEQYSAVGGGVDFIEVFFAEPGHAHPVYRGLQYDHICPDM